jgi:hypothetical protein
MRDRKVNSKWVIVVEQGGLAMEERKAKAEKGKKNKG